MRNVGRLFPLLLLLAVAACAPDWRETGQHRRSLQAACAAQGGMWVRTEHVEGCVHTREGR